MTGTSPRGALEELARGELAGWRGLPPSTSLDDLGAVGDLDHTWRAPGVLGERARPMEWLNALLSGWERPFRVWVEQGGDHPVLLDSEYPALEGGPDAVTAALGEPGLVLDAYLGTLLIPHSELVYPARGLALFVNPEMSILLRVAVFAPTDAAIYRRDLRLDPRARRLPLRRRL